MGRDYEAACWAGERASKTRTREMNIERRKKAEWWTGQTQIWSVYLKRLVFSNLLVYCGVAIKTISTKKKEINWKTEKSICLNARCVCTDKHFSRRPGVRNVYNWNDTARLFVQIDAHREWVEKILSVAHYNTLIIDCFTFAATKWSHLNFHFDASSEKCHNSNVFKLHMTLFLNQRQRLHSHFSFSRFEWLRDDNWFFFVFIRCDHYLWTLFFLSHCMLLHVCAFLWLQLTDEKKNSQKVNDFCLKIIFPFLMVEHVF